MRPIYNTIIGLALTYLVGGCASTGALEQQRKDAELDALLSEPIPEMVMLRPVESEPAPQIKTRTSQRPSEPKIDFSQYLITPEDRAAQARAETEEARRVETEGKVDMARRYQSCKEDLRYKLPPNATGECNGTQGARYIDCAFTIDGRTHGVRVPGREVEKKGAEAAYQLLVAKEPALLEEMAKRHCTVKERSFEFEEADVLGQSSLDYKMQTI